MNNWIKAIQIVAQGLLMMFLGCVLPVAIAGWVPEPWNIVGFVVYLVVAITCLVKVGLDMEND